MRDAELIAAAVAHAGVSYPLQHRAEADQSLVSEQEVPREIVKGVGTTSNREQEADNNEQAFKGGERAAIMW
ncbi:hypothetical protein Cni_G19570 [Canna indica]|uniref:Uncharacterized protein n=1 Tax=Canna indica TaxID=4628 RepID=A0AAQ3KRM6_9LILI|nr:hypothetical protein Cni_G19570 [Canna indica]